jgi:hypothetical protein
LARYLGLISAVKIRIRGGSRVIVTQLLYKHLGIKLGSKRKGSKQRASKTV